jgi:putative flippase GtrA
MSAVASKWFLPERVLQFVKFCLVGGIGVFVDMAVLYLLADPRTLALNIAFSKVCAAEVALINNFLWNEFWTFRTLTRPSDTLSHPMGEGRGEGFPRLRRFLFFNAICGLGILFAVLLLHLFHTLLGWNLYVSNLLTITLVTLWNFGMNARFNWSEPKICGLIAAVSAMISLFGPSRGSCSVLEEFKSFINEKPTIEVFEFRVRTVKNRIQGVAPSTQRLFRATYQEGVGYSILEDRSALSTRIFKSFLVGGYGGEHWHSFDGSNVIVENSKSSMSKDGPARFHVPHLAVALDALNFGIFDLFTNRVAWSGATFVCASNATGFSIHGTLSTNREGEPDKLSMVYERNRIVRQFLVKYEFDKSRGLPDFFPSRIWILRSDGETLSDYDILRLETSRRSLTFGDVDYSKWRHPTANPYVFSNDNLYASSTNQDGTRALSLIPRAIDVRPSRHASRLIAIIAILISAPFVALLFAKLRGRRTVGPGRIVTKQ